MSQIVIGLTGGIASGKSEVGRRFEQLGATVIDADVVAREVVLPGSPALSAIARRFGADVLLPDGTLDRALLRRLVFADPAARQDLEAITHPAIRASMRQQCEQASSPYAIAAIPLLAEADPAHYRWLKKVVVVDVSPEVQMSRLLERDKVPPELAQQMIQAQASRQQRLAIADHVIDNSGQRDQLQAPIQALHENFLRLANDALPG